MDKGGKQRFDTCAKLKIVILNGFFFSDNSYNFMI